MDYFAPNNGIFDGAPTLKESNVPWTVDEIVEETVNRQRPNESIDGTAKEGNVDDSIYDNEEDTIIMAPGEGENPLPILRDENCDEQAFLNLFGGQICQFLVDRKYHQSDRVKWMFRNRDRRCAKDLQYLFYSAKKLHKIRLQKAIEINVKRTGNTADINAEVALDKEAIEQFIESEEMSYFMRSIRSTPQFWRWKKMEINAFIFQLGCPTFFITLSPYEIVWYDLIMVLSNVIDNRNITREEAEQLPREERIRMVNQDPVTVMRYYENRMTALLNAIFNESGPFKDNLVKDYVYRLDFQMRGSPHIHMQVWLKDAPRYKKPTEDLTFAENTIECCTFIDKYITTFCPDDGFVRSNAPGLENKEVCIDYQRHAHKANCFMQDKDQNDLCKYRFPWPIMKKTMILEPLKNEKDSSEHAIAYDRFLKIRQLLTEVDSNLKENPTHYITLDKFLLILNINFEQYIKALRSSITSSTVFLERDCRAIMINPYIPMIYVLNQSNMDTQFIIDPYGLAVYLTSYMMKSKSSMSKLLRDLEKDLKKQNISRRTVMNRIAHTFQNCVEFGVQSAVADIFSITESKSSRKTEFINTYPIEQRNRILKSDEQLRRLAGTSTKVYQKTTLEHYANRPNSTEIAVNFGDMCLAEYVAEFVYISNTKYQKIQERNLIRTENVSDDSEEDDEIALDVDEIIPRTDDAVDNNMYRQLKSDGYIRARTISRILRYKKYNKNKEPNNYFRSQIMLFYPWRKEEEFLSDNCAEYFNNNIEIIALNRARYQNLEAQDYMLALDQADAEIEQYYEGFAADEVMFN